MQQLEDTMSNRVASELLSQQEGARMELQRQGKEKLSNAVLLQSLLQDRSGCLVRFVVGVGQAQRIVAFAVEAAPAAPGHSALRHDEENSTGSRPVQIPKR